MRKASFCIILLTVAIFLAGARPAAAAPRYTWLDLTAAAAPDFSSVYPNGIDSAGGVVAKAYLSTSAPAFLNPGGARPAPLQPTDGESEWRAILMYSMHPIAVLSRLGADGPPEPNKGWEAKTIGKGGKHVGGSWSDTSNNYHAWVEQRGGAATWNLGSLGGNGSWVNAVNDAGQAVGAARKASGAAVAFLYSGGVMQDLNSLAQNLPPGVILAEAYGINNAGQVVGFTNGARATAFLYDGAYHDLGTLDPPYNGWSCGYAINSSGQVAGDSSGTSGGYHAFLYSNDKMEDLGVLPGGLDSRAYGVNDLGQVVGYSTSATDVRAFLYRDGVMHDLNSLLVQGLPAGAVVAQAFGINDRGQIIATSDRGRAYLLTPIVSTAAPIDLLLLQ
jgi:probable HAF family extracellular repeat protein